MAQLKILEVDQCLHENMEWQRMLDFCLQENAFLKTRLSQVLENDTDKEFIAKAEHFQNDFIRNDTYIKDFRSDILSLQRSMKEFLKERKTDETSLIKKHKKLLNEVINFERNFRESKKEFNEYLGSFL